MARGKFIVFEGLDGSGKSTQIDILSSTLFQKKIPCFVTAQPTKSTVIGTYLRSILFNEDCPNMYLQAALFFADRLEHIWDTKNGIEKQLSAGITVICDRYYYSSFAYQGLTLDKQWIMNLNLNCKDIIDPDLCIFLDIDPKICVKRMSLENKICDVYENLKTMEDVRNNYFKVFDMLDDRHRIIKIDAQRDKQDVANSILEIVENLN